MNNVLGFDTGGGSSSHTPMFKPRTALFLLAADPETPGGGKADPKPIDPAAALATIENKTLPMSERLTVAANALRGIAPTEQFAKVSADLATAQASLKTATADLTTAQARITALEADVAAFEKSNAALESENVNLKAAEQDLDKRAKAQAKEEMKALGFPSSQLPNPDPKLASVGSYAEALAEYGKIKEPTAAAAYWTANVQPWLKKK